MSVQCIAQYSKADNKSECNVGCWFPYIFHPSIHPSIKNSPYISLKGTWCSAATAAMHAQYSRAGAVLAWAAGLGSNPLSQLESKPNANIGFLIGESLARYFVQWPFVHFSMITYTMVQKPGPTEKKCI